MDQSFDTHADEQGWLTQAGGAPAERPTRFSRLLAGNMRLENGRVIKVRVRNISSGGIGGKADSPIEPWQRVEIMLPGLGTAAGQIVWIKGDQFGMQLEHAIDPADVIAATGMRQSDYVVPERFRPYSDFRRPGVKGNA